MDTLDAQCLIAQLTIGEISPPDLWRHHRSGELSCAYSGGEQTFTWPPEDVAEMARSWRNTDRSEVPDQVQLFVDAHRRLEALVKQSGLAPPDVVLHDLRRAEIRGVWEDEKLVLVVDDIGESGHADA
jgi:hypothetical protein